MSWKNKIKTIIFIGAIFVILILAAFITLVLLQISNPDKLLSNYSSYEIPIIVASASGLGIMIYIGNGLARMRKYGLIEVSLGFKIYTIVVGSLFLIAILAAYFSYKQDTTQLYVLGYILVMGFLAVVSGLAIAFRPDNKRVTLKMLTYDEHGDSVLVTMNDLVLYQRTSTDYRFKDVNNGKEFIIPIEQIQQIESQ